MKRRNLAPAILLLGLCSPGLAFATNGYFTHGYGVKSQGIAGIGIALPQDGLAAATNPAGTAWIGDRADIGVTWFRPNRGAEIKGNDLGPYGSLDGHYDGNGTRAFLIPELGYVKQLAPQWAAGVAVYGNGGMNTDYGSNPFARLGGTGSAGINLEQLFVSPSLAYKLNDSHAIGLALNLAYQRFEAKGIQPFTQASASPGNVTNRGTDSSTGWGARIGYTGKLTPALTVGATYATKTRMGNFDKYKGLFAEDGGFDVPANFGIGLAWQASKALTLAADVQRIELSDIRSVGNPIANLLAGNPLGSSNGGGFGWRDVTVVKIGAAYELTHDWTVRGGYSHATQPVPSSQTFFNILAPGIVQDHLSLGASLKQGKDGELSIAYTHAFKTTVNGSGSIPPGSPLAGGFGGGEANLHMSEDIFAIAYGWKY